MGLLADHLALRLEAFRQQPAFLDGAAARDHVEKYLRPIHEAGQTRAYVRSGRVHAVMAWRYDEASWFGPPVHTLTLDHRLAPDDALEPWLRETLSEVLPTLDAELDLLIDASYVPAYRVLRELGLGVDSLQLLGDVATASARLRPGPIPEGVSIEPMTLADLDAVLALYATTFATEPEYCWFGANPKFLERQRARFEKTLADPAHLELVLRTEDGVRGHASGTVDPANPLWGPTAGMGLCFAPELRGRGVLRPVYTKLLEGMRARGARCFKGGTSQPSVMKLGREMHRSLQGVNLRRATRFGEAHFAPYLPLRASLGG